MGSGAQLAGNGEKAGLRESVGSSSPQSLRLGPPLCSQEQQELLEQPRESPPDLAESGPACSPVTVPPQQGREQWGLVR